MARELIVVISSAPGTSGGASGVALARERAADVLLEGMAIPYAQKDWLHGYCGTVYVRAGELKKANLLEPLQKGVRALDDVDMAKLLDSSEIIGKY